MTSNSSTSDYVVKETVTVNFTIDNFKNLTSYFYSNYFSPLNSKNKFSLYLNSKTKLISSEQVCITLWYNENENEVPIRYRVSILNANGEKQYTQEYRWDYRKSDTKNSYKHLNYTNFIEHNSCVGYLINGKLILNCQVEVLEKSQAAHHKTTSSSDTGQTNLQNDYQALLENSEFSDVVLLVKDKEFKVHKAILATRSKVFRAMFSNDLEEKKQNRVEITDVEVDVFEHLLRYIYSGKIVEMSESTLDLFVAADKYQLENLKSTCEQYLCSNLTIESVIKVLVIADMHNSSDLKSKCVEYITSNSNAVIATDEWKQLKSRPDLLMELFEKLSIQSSIIA